MPSSGSIVPPPAPPEAAAAETAPLERKLAAILAADIEGYSRLMHADEEGTLATLTAHRKIVDEIILRSHGEIFGAAGDSVLAEFPSVVEAFQCAIAMQQAVEKANAALPEARRMHFRVAINVGDVIVKGADIFGDGVNIASRLEALTEPGGICVTRAVRDQLRDRVETRFEDLGEHHVKNISRPIRAFRVIFDRQGETALPEPAEQPPTPPEPDDAAEAAPSDSVEIAFWQSVQASDDEAEYRIYLERYPEGAFADLAEARLRGTSAVDDTGVELSFWETIRDSGDAAMIRAYLEKYPGGQFRSLAEIMLAKLSAPPS